MLERNVTTQLRKILFSALVYGALVVVCLGGVVWGLAMAVSNVLPIHYSSNQPVLEFPIDLLFYNFLMPLAINFFKPSDGLHAMYTWWFRKCARALRITWFLFGERRVDEEGVLTLKPDSSLHQLPWWRKLFLEYSQGEVVPKTWSDTFEGGDAKPNTPVSAEEMMLLNLKKSHLVQSKQLVPEGRFVRAPASDQVKIPKGGRVFLDVTEMHSIPGSEEKDQAENQAMRVLYPTDQYQLVYVPPHFRVRVFLFILFIWIFAAVTGVGITIMPLVFGRCMFRLLIPAHIRINDIYAFSIGIYILGSLSYVVLHAPVIVNRLKHFLHDTVAKLSNEDAVQRAAAVAYRAGKILYAYFFLLLVFPLLASTIVELYLLIPLHTYMYPGGWPVTSHGEAPRHTIRVIQTWTLGLLYLKLAARSITIWHHNTRLAGAIRAVLRRGWLDPHVGILTRAFIVPGLILAIAAIAWPLLAVYAMIATGTEPASFTTPTDVTLLYRLSYPAAALSCVGMWGMWGAVHVLQSWKVRIRDEAYLMGERLHNFGVGTVPRARRAWRVGPGGARL